MRRIPSLGRRSNSGTTFWVESAAGLFVGHDGKFNFRKGLENPCGRGPCIIRIGRDPCQSQICPIRHGHMHLVSLERIGVAMCGATAILKRVLFVGMSGAGTWPGSRKASASRSLAGRRNREKSFSCLGRKHMTVGNLPVSGERTNCFKREGLPNNVICHIAHDGQELLDQSTAENFLNQFKVSYRAPSFPGKPRD